MPPLPQPSTLASWLTVEVRAPAPYERFETADVSEHAGCTDELKRHLAALIQESAVDRELLEDLAELAGWDVAALALDQRLPTDTRATRGRFGEVLSGAALKEFDGYLVPVEKAQYAITRGQSQPSTDLLALQIDADGEVREVCFVESKLRTTADTAAPAAAAHQLAVDYSHRIPDMITFTAARLRERGDDLYWPFMRYFASREDDPPDTFRVATFYDAARWSETALQNLEDADLTVAPLAVVVTQLTALRDLVDEVFDLVGLIAEDDE